MLECPLNLFYSRSPRVSYYFEEKIMAKKKPAAKLPVKKPLPKKMAKKPVAKAPPKKVAPMAKKSPVKTKASSKAVAKKVAPKKVEKKPAPKATLKETVLKAASKLISKAKPLSKEQIKAQKEKERIFAAKEKARLEKEKSKEKVLSAKDKEREAKDKAKQKELEKKQKEQEKLKAKAEKEAEKNRAKEAKKKPKSNKHDDEDDDIELGPDDEPAFGEEERVAKKNIDDDVDEFEEDYKKSKASKKSGKKAYETDDHIEIYTPKISKKYNNAAIAELEAGVADEIAQLREHFNWKDIAEAIGTMDFFIDPKNDECIEKGCDNIRTTQSYCRLHYLRNWKTVQKKRDILKEGKLQEYIEELISKYPPKYIESLLSDLSDDKEFYRVLNELNITSEFDFEEDEFENAVDDDDSDDDIGIETISSSLRYEDE